MNELTLNDFKKPAATEKTPTGRGYTKGDELIRRLKAEFHYDPLSELVKLAKSEKTSSGEKVKIATEILSYMVPKLKAVEVKQNHGETIKINIFTPESGAAQAQSSSEAVSVESFATKI